MNFTLRQLEEIKSNLRPKLGQFLKDSGISVNRDNFFSCISPTHSDTNPSCRLLPDTNMQQFYCYSCGYSGDIFTAANVLKGYPINGLGFIEDSVYKLADTYNVDYERVDFTPEQLEKLQWHRTVGTIASLMSVRDIDEKPINWNRDAAEKRGWDLGVCGLLNIATVDNYEKFLNDVQKATGLTKTKLIEDFEVTPQMFGPEKLTLTLYDASGRPIGFSARAIDWKKGSRTPKYKNSRTSILFEKTYHLYNIHIAKKNKMRRLDVFEGFGSVISSMAQGHTSCVATCGTAFTENQVNLIIRLGFKHINIVADPDEDGLKAAYRHMEELQGRENLKVTLTVMPSNEDADEYIIKNGLPAFLKIPTISAFEFFLNKEKELAKSSGVDQMTFVNRMIQMIINTSSKLERGQQIKALAKYSNFAEIDIREEIERLSNEDTKNTRDEMARQISRAKNGEEIVEIAEVYLRKLEETSDSKQEKHILSFQESAESVQELKTILANRKVGIQGWKTGFSILDELTSGFPKPIGQDENGKSIPTAGSLVGIAGAPQHCKTAIIQNLVAGMAMNNDDIIQLVWSLDDSRQRFLERIVAMISGVPWRVVTRRAKPTQEQEVKINQTIERITEFAIDGKLVIKDRFAGTTLPILKRWIDQVQQEYQKPVLVVIDSFHKIGASSGDLSKTEFAITKSHSSECKTIAQAKKVSMLTSLELNKTQLPGQEPTLSHITESRKMEYDFDTIATTYNPYHDLQGHTDQYVVDLETGLKQPVIKLNIRKNKDGETGPVYMVYNPSLFRMKCYNEEDVRSLIDSSKDSPITLSNSVSISIPRSSEVVEEEW